MLLEVGKVVRVHGLKGEVVVDLSTNIDERVAVGSVLYSDPDGETKLVVVTSRPHQNRWLVRFESMVDRTAAEALGRPRLYAEPIDDAEAIWVHELFGALVVDADGIERGTVSEVLDSPASELLVLDTGHLVPLDFVVSSNDGRVIVEVPDGLWEL
ncbi:MAG: ribosome maturation factor RimM [Actinomycetia bacterium]|nr:ribosome maturation factor RimM [Actinomycetes bacterium]MCP4959086.1 ribosome maturation factor RimM [Actinomycetes bacterium]